MRQLKNYKNRPALGAESTDPVASGGWGLCSQIPMVSGGWGRSSPPLRIPGYTPLHGLAYFSTCTCVKLT